MSKERPGIVTFIGYICILSAFLSILSLFPKFLKQFGFHVAVIPLPIFSDGIMQLLPPIILLIISYGYLKLKIWGYWLMIINSIFFLVIYIVFYQQSGQLFHCQNAIITFIELVFIVPTRRYFV